MQSRISKLPRTVKQKRREFIRTWMAIGLAYVSASNESDLSQILETVSSRLIRDHFYDDYRELCDDHSSPAATGTTACMPNSTIANPESKADSTHPSAPRNPALSSLFGGSAFAARPPSPTGRSGFKFNSAPTADNSTRNAFGISKPDEL